MRLTLEHDGLTWVYEDCGLMPPIATAAIWQIQRALKDLPDEIITAIMVERGKRIAVRDYGLEQDKLLEQAKLNLVHKYENR